MAWTTPVNYTTGDLITAAIWNAQVKANMDVLRAAGFALSSQAVGDLLYASSTTQFARLADVATGSVLVSGGVGVAPAWSTAPTIAGTNISSIPAANLTGTIASATQDAITRTGTLVSGATGAGFTVALSTSTITGTLADARLSANVPLLNAANTFTAAQTISFANPGISALVIDASTGTNAVGARMTNTGGNFYRAMDDSTGSIFGYGNYAAVLASGTLMRINAATSLTLGVGASAIMTLATGVIIGAPTGGDKGAGTLNCTAAYDDNVLLSDALWDLYYDGSVRLEDRGRWGRERLLSIAETAAFTKEHRHMPSLPGRLEWEAAGSRSLGEMVTALWQTVERLQMHIFELHARLEARA